MIVISGRKKEILSLMGVDLWTRRPVASVQSVVASPRQAGQGPACSESGVEPGDDPWCLLPGQDEGVRTVWVFCQENSHTLTANRSCRRFLEDILGAMGFKWQDVTFFCRRDVNTRNEARTAGQILRTRQDGSPELVVALGRECGEWVRTHVKGMIVGSTSNEHRATGQCSLLLGEDLQTLMSDPSQKVSLWRQLVSSGLVMS